MREQRQIISAMTGLLTNEGGVVSVNLNRSVAKTTISKKTCHIIVIIPDVFN